jgi:hypothetical protein
LYTSPYGETPLAAEANAPSASGQKGFSNFNIFFTKISNVKIQLKIMKMK